VRFIAAHKARWGVEPICRVLQVAPSSYYAAVGRPASNRDRRDEVLKREIVRVWTENRKVYGADKVWDQLRREGITAGRCTVERLMRELGIRGVVRGPRKPGGQYAPGSHDGPADLVQRHFHAPAPNRLWVADLTYVQTRSGWVYVAFIVDVFSRFVVGWKVATRLYTELALDALEMACWARHINPQSQLTHHSDRGVQYLAGRYAQRLAQAGILASVGSRADSYDNALAESFNGLYKTELIHRGGPWAGVQDVEHATLSYIDWFNHRRLHSAIGMRPPAEVEALYYHQSTSTAKAASH
jgi:putative transposase